LPLIPSAVEVRSKTSDYRKKTTKRCLGSQHHNEEIKTQRQRNFDILDPGQEKADSCEIRSVGAYHRVLVLNLNQEVGNRFPIIIFQME
jgi:hypothetical protein